MYNSISNTGIIGKKVVYLPSCHSTNDIAAELVHQKAFEEGTVVITDNQTGGRGQRGTNWSSVTGMNLTFSILLKPKGVPIMEQFLLSQTVAIGLVTGLKELGLVATIKWPNDIYIGDRKICGTLIENSIQGGGIASTIAGIGLNVNQLDFGAIRATSLALLSGKKWSLQQVFEVLLIAIDKALLRLYAGEVDAIRSLYRDKLLGMNEIRGFKVQGQLMQATVVGVTAQGRLLLRTLQGSVLEMDLKELQWLWEH
ncbi:BirA family biotin operon repressor/biotin-[acetyl-CoA-carboxylase] ligase [Dyadobacter jejuensis]|uniref:BirA family biotin operon repressor/biotin-[acetyl-CoA-carboxylase] ligase n=1 Tax=Dyadobacter jejuensis TaxID=1082580 RepID=A0A316AMF0_9BACT|nr:biotin--[acetyl-CoA-carboxylase] ligase [Dyadobacter jejuensis]PWJ58244.1 BirA family biotin operon repressor/biotin-[acetyl-CoA-carboxylase] ligase [Dyadobacter jejuensis]